MKVTIKSWAAVAAWRWDVRDDNDLCGICRVEYDATCPVCKFPGDGCPLVGGTCKHTFHAHCLQGWLEQESSQGKCPMCRQAFVIAPEYMPESATSPARANAPQT